MQDALRRYADKVRRIAMLGCTCFIDDLDEVLSDPAFPPINRILFHSNGAPSVMRHYPICTTWEKIQAEVFGGSD